MTAQTWKVSRPERTMAYDLNDRPSPSWRIRRQDGELVGWFATRALAQREIDTSPWLQ